MSAESRTPAPRRRSRVLHVLPYVALGVAMVAVLLGLAIVTADIVAPGPFQLPAFVPGLRQLVIIAVIAKGVSGLLVAITRPGMWPPGPRVHWQGSGTHDDGGTTPEDPWT